MPRLPQTALNGNGAHGAGADRRIEPRFLTNDTVEIHVLRSPELKGIRGQTLDVSRSGLRLWIEDPIPQGALILVRMKQMRVLGEARYCRSAPQRGYQIGVRIVHAHDQLAPLEDFPLPGESAE